MILLEHMGVLGATSRRHALLDPYLNTMSARPSGQHQWLYNRLLWELSDSNAIPSGGVIHFGGETEQASLQNMVRAAHPLTKIGTPTYTANLGFQSNTQASRLATTEDIFDVPGSSINSFMFGVFCNTSNNTNGYDVGAGNYGRSLTAYTTASNLGMYGYPHNASYFNTGIVAVTTAVGMSILSRTSANTSFLMRDGTAFTSSLATTASGVADKVNFIAPSSGNVGNRRESIGMYGSGFSTAQAADFCTAINRFLSAW